MNAYPLEILLRVLLRREDRAEKKMKQARARVATCQQEVEARQAALRDYKAWCEREAERIFGLIEKTTVPHWRIMSAREEVSWNTAQTGVYEQAILKAQEELEEAQKAAAECLVELQRCSREVYKIRNHKDLWGREEMARSEAAEEMLVDENATNVFLYHQRK